MGEQRRRARPHAEPQRLAEGCLVVDVTTQSVEGQVEADVTTSLVTSGGVRAEAGLHRSGLAGPEQDRAGSLGVRDEPALDVASGGQRGVQVGGPQGGDVAQQDGAIASEWGQSDNGRRAQL